MGKIEDLGKKIPNGASLECCGMSELTEYIYGEIKGDLSKSGADLKEESIAFH